MFEALKKKTTNLTQKALVAIGQSEEFKETDEFIKTIENFKQTRTGMIEVLEKGKQMSNDHDAANLSTISYYEKIIEFAGKQEGLDPRVVKYAEALKKYVDHSKAFWTSVSSGILVPQDEFLETEMSATRDFKDELSETRTARDFANRDRTAKDAQTFKSEKAGQEWKRLDDKYQSDRALLLEHVAYIEKKKNNDLLKNVSMIFMEQYNMHATAYSDMATIEPEVKAALEQAKAAANTLTPPPPYAIPVPATSSASTPSATPK
jgi:hypothetical protein